MVLAIDFGDRHIGLALGSPPETPVHRYGSIDQKSTDAKAHIQQIVLKEGVTKVLVGVPVSLSGEETEQTYKSLQFIEALQAVLPTIISVESIDETLTSVEAQKNLAFEGASAEDEHAEAARIMLSDYFKQFRI